MKDKCMAFHGTGAGHIESEIEIITMWMYDSIQAKEGYSQPEDRRQCEAPTGTQSEKLKV